MSTMINANIPVSNIERSIAFYTSLGFKQSNQFSSKDTTTMIWDDNFWIVLITHDFLKKIIRDKKIADTNSTVGMFISFYVESPDIVKKIAEIAKQNGGYYYQVDVGVPEEDMCGYEILDPDGNIIEVTWMNM